MYKINKNGCFTFWKSISFLLLFKIKKCTKYITYSPYGILVMPQPIICDSGVRGNKKLMVWIFQGTIQEPLGQHDIHRCACTGQHFTHNGSVSRVAVSEVLCREGHQILLLLLFLFHILALPI